MGRGDDVVTFFLNRIDRFLVSCVYLVVQTTYLFTLIIGHRERCLGLVWSGLVGMDGNSSRLSGDLIVECKAFCVFIVSILPRR